MAYDETKMNRFEDTVLAEADEKIQKIKKETEEYEETELKKTRQTEYDKMFTYMQAKVHELQWKYKRQITKSSLDAKRQTLETRNQLVHQVFADCESRLMEFASSDQYKDYLLKKAKQATEKFECSGAQILVRKQDMQFEAELLQATKAATVAIDKTNQLGGFKMINHDASLLLDETLASYLAEQRQYFYQTSGLTVEN